MTNQEKLNRLLDELANEYLKFNAKQQQLAITEIDRVRLEISDLLADFSGNDGIIKRQRLNRLLRELDTIEKAVRKNGMDALDKTITDATEFTTERIKSAMEETLGKAAIAGIAFDRVNQNVFRYVVNREEKDGLILSDRVWRFAGDQRDELSKVLRSAILRGESVNQMIADVRQVYENDTWKIKRLVVTEGNMAYRTATVYSARQSNLVEAVQIFRGKANRPEHRCTQLEKLNRYGMGPGIYKLSDPEVFNPHPNCTSHLNYVLTEKAVRDDAE